LEAREETAPLSPRDLAEVSRAGAIFTAEAEALHHPRENEDRGREPADRRRRRHCGDDQRAGAHQADAQRQSGLAPVPVGIDAHDPSPDRPHDEADREDRGGVQELGGAIAGGKEDRREIERKGGVDVPVIPFDEIARRAADDIAQAVRGWPFGSRSRHDLTSSFRRRPESIFSG
jgi:hypothetical protein